MQENLRKEYILTEKQKEYLDRVLHGVSGAKVRNLIVPVLLRKREVVRRMLLTKRRLTKPISKRFLSCLHETQDIMQVARLASLLQDSASWFGTEPFKNMFTDLAVALLSSKSRPRLIPRVFRVGEILIHKDEPAVVSGVVLVAFGALHCMNNMYHADVEQQPNIDVVSPAPRTPSVTSRLTQQSRQACNVTPTARSLSRPRSVMSGRSRKPIVSVRPSSTTEGDQTNFFELIGPLIVGVDNVLLDRPHPLFVVAAPTFLDDGQTEASCIDTYYIPATDILEFCQEYIEHHPEHAEHIRSRLAQTRKEVLSERFPLTEVMISRGSWLFSSLPERAIRTMIPLLQPVCVPKGTVLVTAGKLCPVWYFLRRGSLEVTVPASDGEQKEQRFHFEQGVSFGEMSLVFNETRSVTVTVESRWADLWMLRRHTMLTQLLHIHEEWEAALQQRAALLRKEWLRTSCFLSDESEGISGPLIRALQNSVVFQNVPGWLLAKLARHAHPHVFSHRSLIAAASELCDRFVVIRRGKASSLRPDHQVTFGPGDVLGQGCLVAWNPGKKSGLKWPFGVSSVTMVDVWIIHREALLKVLRQDPQENHGIWKQVIQASCEFAVGEAVASRGAWSLPVEAVSPQIPPLLVPAAPAEQQQQPLATRSTFCLPRHGLSGVLLKDAPTPSFELLDPHSRSALLHSNGVTTTQPPTLAYFANLLPRDHHEDGQVCAGRVVPPVQLDNSEWEMRLRNCVAPFDPDFSVNPIDCDAKVFACLVASPSSRHNNFISSAPKLNEVTSSPIPLKKKLGHVLRSTNKCEFFETRKEVTLLFPETPNHPETEEPAPSKDHEELLHSCSEEEWEENIVLVKGVESQVPAEPDCFESPKESSSQSFEEQIEKLLEGVEISSSNSNLAKPSRSKQETMVSHVHEESESNSFEDTHSVSSAGSTPKGVSPAVSPVGENDDEEPKCLSPLTLVALAGVTAPRRSDTNTKGLQMLLEAQHEPQTHTVRPQTQEERDSGEEPSFNPKMIRRLYVCGNEVLLGQNDLSSAIALGADPLEDEAHTVLSLQERLEREHLLLRLVEQRQGVAHIEKKRAAPIVRAFPSQEEATSMIHNIEDEHKEDLEALVEEESEDDEVDLEFLQRCFLVHPQCEPPKWLTDNTHKASTTSETDSVEDHSWENSSKDTRRQVIVFGSKALTGKRKPFPPKERVQLLATSTVPQKKISTQSLAFSMIRSATKEEKKPLSNEETAQVSNTTHSSKTIHSSETTQQEQFHQQLATQKQAKLKKRVQPTRSSLSHTKSQISVQETGTGKTKCWRGKVFHML